MPYLSPQELIESSAITKLAPRNTAGGYYWEFPDQTNWISEGWEVDLPDQDKRQLN